MRGETPLTVQMFHRWIVNMIRLYPPINFGGKILLLLKEQVEAELAAQPPPEAVMTVDEG